MKFEELRELYKKHFSLAYFGNSIENRLTLICLICYVTYKSKLKNPDITHYQVIKQISGNIGGVTEDFEKALAIICEDYSYMCTDFPTFGLKGKEILDKIKEIITNYLPF